MALIKLFIANTIDGYIARESGAIDWLQNLPNPDNSDFGYYKFIEGISTIFMGRATYEEVLGFGVEWPYPNFQTYVVTTDTSYEVKTKNTSVVHKINELVIDLLKSQSEKDIWVVGGGKLIQSFIDLKAIDEMTISIIPLILGKGIRLFPEGTAETGFSLVDATPFKGGVVNLTYKKA